MLKKRISWWLIFTHMYRCLAFQVIFFRDVNTKVHALKSEVRQSVLPTNATETNLELEDSSESNESNKKLANGETRRNEHNDKPVMRTGHIVVNKAVHESHSTKANNDVINQQHQKRLAELEEYLKTHMMSTIYFHEEMNRIIRQRKVKDSLRKMVTVLEHEPDMKQKVLTCYRRYEMKLKKTSDLWKHKTNDLVINYMYDY